MRQIEFWENAEERCPAFREAEQENTERCAACGDVIPEGRMVCPKCESGDKG
jgi:uncharacterized OB-fold protein